MSATFFGGGSFPIVAGFAIAAGTSGVVRGSRTAASADPGYFGTPGKPPDSAITGPTLVTTECRRSGLLASGVFAAWTDDDPNPQHGEASQGTWTVTVAPDALPGVYYLSGAVGWDAVSNFTYPAYQSTLYYHYRATFGLPYPILVRYADYAAYANSPVLYGDDVHVRLSFTPDSGVAADAHTSGRFVSLPMGMLLTDQPGGSASASGHGSALQVTLTVPVGAGAQACAIIADAGQAEPHTDAGQIDDGWFGRKAWNTRQNGTGPLTLSVIPPSVYEPVLDDAGIPLSLGLFPPIVRTVVVQVIRRDGGGATNMARGKAGDQQDLAHDASTGHVTLAQSAGGVLQSTRWEGWAALSGPPSRASSPVLDAGGTPVAGQYPSLVSVGGQGRHSLCYQDAAGRIVRADSDDGLETLH